MGAVRRRGRGPGRGPLSAVGGEIGGTEPNERGGGAGVPDGVGVDGRIEVAPGWNTGWTPELRHPRGGQEVGAHLVGVGVAVPRVLGHAAGRGSG